MVLNYPLFFFLCIKKTSSCSRAEYIQTFLYSYFITGYFIIGLWCTVYKSVVELPQCVLGDLPADRRVPQPPQHEHVEYDDDREGDRVAGYEEGELPDGQVVLLLVELTPLYKRLKD